MPSVQDIIQRILIEGDRAAISVFNRIGSAGEAAFSAVGAAADRVAAPFKGFQANLDDVENKAKSFGTSVRDLGTSLGSLVSRVGVATAGLAAGGGLILKGMLNISTALKEVSASIIQQRLAIGETSKEQKKAVITDFAHANALEDLALKFRETIRSINDTRDAQEDLDRNLAAGKITAKQYADQQAEMQFQVARATRKAFEDRQRQEKELRDQQARSLAQARQLAVEEEDIRQQRAQDEAIAQRRQIALKLEATYGAALAGVLINLGNVLDSVRQRFLGTFGPQIASFLTSVVQAIQNAAPEIFAVFQKVSDAIASTFKQSGLSADEVVKGFVKFGGDVANIFIKIVIPAISGFIAILTEVAQFINAIFGTNFTASTLVAAALILKVTGFFGLFVNVIRLAVTGIGLLFTSFGPLGIAIGIIVAIIATQLIPLLAKIDWAAVAQKASDAWKFVTDAFNTAVAAIKGVWNSVVEFFQTKINAIIGFFNDLIAKVREFLGLTGGSAAGSQLAADAGANDIGKFAGGGLFRGRGGNDRNVIAVSDYEYIVNPKAVRHWGVGFLNAINAMSNPLRGFAAGGLVAPMTGAAPAVAFARSGNAAGGGGRPLVLQIGDQVFDGLTVQDNTADSMARYAQRRGVRSAGRRPMWFGGGKS
jgi:hypothetical protein